MTNQDVTKFTFALFVFSIVNLYLFSTQGNLSKSVHYLQLGTMHILCDQIRGGGCSFQRIIFNHLGSKRSHDMWITTLNKLKTLHLLQKRHG